ncbi:alpha/beta fold hydrolase [Actinomadura roseirufa]|uniref:alpha/beta fold hydrolase n=1 Tax=Actinomadura roseirufa TaxID=2094049 RepID=UPI001041BCE3|nr:alpha/beta fold hydrolase [Actinomadura roseirufa]
MTDAAAAEDLLRSLAPQVLGTLVRRHGSFDACEDAVQEALLAAALQWPGDGVPANPRGWLLTVATRRLTDQWRSESARRDREAAVAAWEPPAGPVPAPGEDDPAGRDDTLTLLFLCCHPALTPSSQVALTLRAVGGLGTAQIARAFLVPEATMAQRISRAKQRIKATGARFGMPPPRERAERLRAVLHVLYLIFNEGYTASSGPDLQRADLTAEAIRLARALHALLPGDGEVTGLLALMLLTDARRAARTDGGGLLIPLTEQDRSRWNAAEIEEGTALITDALTWSPPGPYQLQAAIAAVHAEAARPEDTDWPQILSLYKLLSHVAPNPMVTLNQAVAVAMVHGPHAGLDLLRTLDDDERTAGHHRLAAVRAHLLETAGDLPAARAAYRTAARSTTSLPEKRYLETRAAGLNGEKTMRSYTLDVPGATLHYEIRGGGPTVLLICGGVYDAEAYSALASLLADRYMVVSYDRRGNSRSPLEGPPEPQSIAEHAEDASRLLSALAADPAFVYAQEPAYVFGNSSGAVIALELAARHPEQVRTVVAHEPPLLPLLPDADHWRAVLADVEETFAKEGPGAAMAKFGVEMGMQDDGGAQDGATEGEAAEGGADQGGPAEAPSPEILEMFARIERNTGFFIGYEVPSFGRHELDLDALRGSSAEIVLVAGEDSEGQPPQRATLIAADRLGVTVQRWPGGHGGFGTDAKSFADRLGELFGEP